MHHDRLNPHYIRGFIKECHDQGLNEEQTSQLLDEQLKYHLAETNEHYQAGIKSAMVKASAGYASPMLLKQANPLGKILGLGAGAGAGALLGGAALNRAPEGVRNIASNGVDLSYGVGSNSSQGNISGKGLGAALGTGLGLATMLRKGKLGQLRKAMPFSKRLLINPHTGKQTSGYGLDLGKAFRSGNRGAAAETLGTAAAGGVAGYFAPSVNKGIEKMVDDGKGYSSLDWLNDTRGTEDPIAPWYADAEGGGQRDLSGGGIPNLSLLPQEVRQEALGTGASSRNGRGSQNEAAGSPNWAIDQAGQRISQIDNQLAQIQTVANDPNQSPMARERARQAGVAMNAQRDQAIAAARAAQQRTSRDQSDMERKMLEERARVASRQRELTAEDERLAKGPQRYEREIDSNPISWLPFRGATPTQGQHQSEQRAVDDMMLRNQQRQWEIENSKLPQLLTPQSQQVLSTYGI